MRVSDLNGISQQYIIVKIYTILVGNPRSVSLLNNYSPYRSNADNNANHHAYIGGRKKGMGEGGRELVICLMPSQRVQLERKRETEREKERKRKERERERERGKHTV